MTEFKKGDVVYFGRKFGEKTLGEIIKVNTKSYKVKTLESRGRTRAYPVGSKWRVPKTLVSAAPVPKVVNMTTGKVLIGVPGALERNYQEIFGCPDDR